MKSSNIQKYQISCFTTCIAYIAAFENEMVKRQGYKIPQVKLRYHTSFGCHVKPNQHFIILSQNSSYSGVPAIVTDISQAEFGQSFHDGCRVQDPRYSDL